MSERLKESEVTIQVKKSVLEKQKHVRTDRYRRIYTNNMLIEFSKWDVSLIFGEILDGKGEVHVIEEVAHVTMSHSFAKVVLSVLSQNIEAFEKQFGEIKILDIESLIGKRVGEPAQESDTAPDRGF